ncbi:MAG: phosphoglycolate phosphatase [Pseudomonadota bacterium]|nr:phosphoglycolate phosphatase [Pseudomonadota bacterium]
MRRPAFSLQRSRIGAAIVDLDGTLVDTLGDFVAVLDGVLRALALPGVNREFVARTVGKGSEHLIRSTLHEVGADPALYERAWVLYQAHYLQVNGQHATVYPGVHEGLTRLAARGWKLACLTNKPTAFAVALLRQKGLIDFFDHVFGGDAFARKKPDPLPVLETCDALGTPASRTLMIGDSSNDARAARSAGCPVVLVSYGYNHGEPVARVDADGVVDRLDQL